MPSHPCKHPTCTEYVKWPATFCPDHADQEKPRERTDAQKAADRYYDRYVRDPAAKAFYNSTVWDRARKKKLANNPVCERCNNAWAKHVHHIKPLKHCTRKERTAQNNLRALCIPCHNIEENEIEKQETDHDQCADEKDSRDRPATAEARARVPSG